MSRSLTFAGTHVTGASASLLRGSRFGAKSFALSSDVTWLRYRTEVGRWRSRGLPNLLLAVKVVDEGDEVVGIQGAGEVVPLYFITPCVFQERELLFVLDTLGERWLEGASI